jgi:hypothetical protein
MATPTIQQGRLITKRSAIPGIIPTVPAVDDIETFIATDIFKGELFYNIPDNILYTRDNTGIIIIASGGAPIPYVYYTENTTPGSEEGKIEVTDGADSGNVIVTPTDTTVSITDGTNNTSIVNDNLNITLETDRGTGLLNNTTLLLNGINGRLLSVDSGGDEGAIRTATGQVEIWAGNFASDYSKTTLLPISTEIKTVNGTDSSYVKTEPTQTEIYSSDGTNNSSILVETASSAFISLGGNITSSIVTDVSGGGSVVLDSTDTTIGNSRIDMAPTYLQIDSADTTIGNSRIEMTPLYLNISHDDIASDTTQGITLDDNLGVKLTSTDNTSSNQSSLALLPTDVTTLVVDATNTTTTAVTSLYSNTSSTDGTDISTFEVNKDSAQLIQENITNDVRSELNLDPAGLASGDATHISTTKISTGESSISKYNFNSIVNEVTDGTNTTGFSQTSTTFKISGIGSYASDAAAGTAGLVTGEIYQTSGTGSGIFATPGILMIKQ